MVLYSNVKLTGLRWGRGSPFFPGATQYCRERPWKLGSHGRQKPQSRVCKLAPLSGWRFDVSYIFFCHQKKQSRSLFPARETSSPNSSQLFGL